MAGDKMPVSNIVDYLNRNVDRPVLDETGLTGKYKVSLEWQKDDLSAGPEGPTAPNLFSALKEQLGLKLEARNKGTVEVTIVDHAEKTPVEN